MEILHHKPLRTFLGFVGCLLFVNAYHCDTAALGIVNFFTGAGLITIVAAVGDILG